jgi:L-alanine-DL-glutamate epimerase-like enolase superfamily enzyme
MRLSRETIETHPKRAFKIAVSSRDAFTMVVARLEHAGVVGLGEASPSKRVTGEDATSVGHFLDWAAKEVEPLGPDELLGFLDHVHDDICGNPTARCALDLAVHDLLGKLRGVPARALYDLPAARIESSMTVSLDEPDVMAAEARGYVEAGHRALKLKLGEARSASEGRDASGRVTTARDVERVRAVRDAVGAGVRLRVDANTGWTGAGDVALTRALADLGVELVEQPVPPADVRGLAAFARESALPVYADEAVLDAFDVERLHQAGFRGGVNLKLMKAGGLRPAVRAARRAKELGYGVQLGCNVETSIGISGAAQLLALLDHADLDGNALLRDDPFVGARLERGWIESPRASGLGVAPRFP